MIDAEVLRLRRLREVALSTRSLAGAFTRGISLTPGTRPLLFDTSICCWRLASVATGRLRAHPYAPYQQDHGRAGRAWDALGARASSLFAVIRGRPHLVFFLQLQRLVRMLDDARALTWHSDLSDTLGRCQHQLSRLTEEWQAVARQETGVQPDADRLALPLARKGDTGVAALEWPYLAI